MSARVLGFQVLSFVSLIVSLLVGCGHAAAPGSLATTQSLRARHPSGQGSTLGGTPLGSNPNAAIGLPNVGSAPEILISRKQYAISWSQVHRQPNYVAWELSAPDFGRIGRQNDFASDPDLQAYMSANGLGNAVGPADFQGSCFDRGHQIPSADRTDSTTDNSETFLMSNMIPQTAYLNRVAWEHLENHERTLVRGTSKTIYIFAGPVFSASPSRIGPNSDIDIPSQDFKIIAQQTGSGLQVLTSVLMPNTTSTGSDPVSDHDQACQDSTGNDSNQSSNANDWQQYITPIAQIEQASGFDFSFLQ